MILEFEGHRPPSLDLFLEYIGISEIEFYQIASEHVVSPWSLIPLILVQEEKLQILIYGVVVMV